MAKPDWSHAPEWANYLSVDDMGCWRWWEFPVYYCEAERWESTGAWLRPDDCVERNGYGRVEIASEPDYPSASMEKRP